MSRKTPGNVKQGISDNSAYISSTTAAALHKSDTINYFLKVLQALLEYWRTFNEDENSLSGGNILLKERFQYSLPDMTPFFLRQFVKGKFFFR